MSASIYTKEVAIGAIALVGIGFHLILRFGVETTATVFGFPSQAIPLFVALTCGTPLAGRSTLTYRLWRLFSSADVSIDTDTGEVVNWYVEAFQADAPSRVITERKRSAGRNAIFARARAWSGRRFHSATSEANRRPPFIGGMPRAVTTSKAIR